VSAERDEMDERHERSKALWEWLRLLRKTAPKETQIDLIRARFDKATDADERRDLKDHLQILLHQTDRIDEALQLGDAWIAENPDDMYAYTCKSRTYLWVDDLDNALDCVELAVACARRTGKWLRTALGYMARILVDMRDHVRNDAILRSRTIGRPGRLPHRFCPRLHSGAFRSQHSHMLHPSSRAGLGSRRAGAYGRAWIQGHALRIHQQIRPIRRGAAGQRTVASVR
jgi:hypothetical protein